MRAPTINNLSKPISSKAAQYGIEFNTNFLYWTRQADVRFNPMHCYTAGIDISSPA